MRTRGAPAALTHPTARHAPGVSSPREMPFGARRWVRRRRPTSSPRARDATAGASRKVRRGKKHESAAHRSRATRQPSQPRSLSNLFWNPNPATERARMKNVDRACCMSKHSEIIAQFIPEFRHCSAEGIFDIAGWAHVDISPGFFSDDVTRGPERAPPGHEGACRRTEAEKPSPGARRWGGRASIEPPGRRRRKGTGDRFPTGIRERALARAPRR